MTDCGPASQHHEDAEELATDALVELKAIHVEAKAAFKKIDVALRPNGGVLQAQLLPELELHEQIEGGSCASRLVPIRAR